MRSTGKVIYAGLLGLSLLVVQPTPAAAEEAHGSFILTHEVHWQKTVLRPGKYRFDIKNFGPSDVLMVSRVDRSRPEVVLMIDSVGVPKANEVSRLVLVSRSGQSFVSDMELPQHEMELHFAVPAQAGGK